MKAKITRAKSFYPLVRYVTDRKKDSDGGKHAEWICGNIMHDSVSQMSREFSAPDKVKKAEKPAYHISLSMPKGEQRLASDRWKEIIERFLELMGISSSHLHCAYRHSDKGHDHVHIIINRVGLDGSVYAGKMDVYTAIEATQRIEREMGLTETEGLGKSRTRLSMGEIKMIERTQKLTEKQKVKVIVAAAIRETMTLEDFALFLLDKGVEAKLNTASNGRISGITFIRGGYAVKGSALGSKYSYNAIIKQLPSISTLGVTKQEGREKRIRSMTR